jgi:hypothetical protein
MGSGEWGKKTEIGDRELEEETEYGEWYFFPIPYSPLPIPYFFV